MKWRGANPRMTPSAIPLFIFRPSLLSYSLLPPHLPSLDIVSHHYNTRLSPSPFLLHGCIKAADPVAVGEQQNKEQKNPQYYTHDIINYNHADLPHCTF